MTYTCKMANFVSSTKLLFCACVLLLLSAFLYTMKQNAQALMSGLHSSDAGLMNEIHNVFTTTATRRDQVNNSGASSYLAKYDDLFNSKKERPSVVPDPNSPETITTWWQAAAMIDWYINSPIRYACQNKTSMGNWNICQDQPFTVKPPCLVYSFGINFDFSFDDAMAKLGCEVHSFDPSMKQGDQKRGNHSTFHNMGISATNSDAYVARQDVYVKGLQVWKMRTVKAIMEELGHQNRVIDVFKMDVEAYEWAILDNMMETDVFKYIRQFSLEFHLFPKFPLKEEYVYLYKTYTRLREMGFREYSVGPHTKTLKADAFNNQGDSEYINAFFGNQS